MTTTLHEGDQERLWSDLRGDMLELILYRLCAPEMILQQRSHYDPKTINFNITNIINKYILFIKKLCVFVLECSWIS